MAGPAAPVAGPVAPGEGDVAPSDRAARRACENPGGEPDRSGEAGPGSDPVADSPDPPGAVTWGNPEADPLVKFVHMKYCSVA